MAILEEEEGRGGSRYIHENVTPGTRIRVRGPKNHFRMEEDAASYVLIAGGIGITPIVAMADRLARLGKPYEIHHGGRALAAMSFVERLKRDHGDRLHLYPKADGRRMVLPERLGRHEVGRQVCACGPARLLAELEGLAEDWPENTLHVEHFTATGSLLDPDRETSFEVELTDVSSRRLPGA